MTDQTAKKLRRYVATVIVGHGTGQQTTRDTKIIFAADDSDAWSKANEWVGTVGNKIVDGDYLQLAENGRGVKGTALRKLP